MSVASYLEDISAFEQTGYLILGVIVVGVIIYIAGELPTPTVNPDGTTNIPSAATSALTLGIYGCGSWTGWGSSDC